MRARIPIAAVAVFGLGALVAVSVGITLYVGAFSGVRNTQVLWALHVEALLDGIEDRLDSQLRPVATQARWIAERIGSGAIDMDDSDELDAFIRGALAATPQVAGIGVVDPDATIKRWGRDREALGIEDWSRRPEIVKWLAEGRTQRGSRWREPFWSQSADATIVLHDTPLRRSGRFLGMLGQIVPVSNLSADIARGMQDEAITPFVLYDRDRVIAHPLLAEWSPGERERDAPLPTIEEVGDAPLEGIWTPDIERPFFLRDLARSKAVGATFGSDRFVYVYRELERYGPRPWIIGVYIDAARTQRGERERLIQSIGIGLTVWLLAVAVAALAGRRLSRPIEAIAAAANRVREGRLDDVGALPRNRIRELDDAHRSFNDMVGGLRERRLIRATLGRFVPEEVAASLLSAGGELEPVEAQATVLFCDLEGFTPLTASLGPAGVVALLNEYFEAMVEVIERHGGVVTQFQGDAILAIFNVPIADPDHAANALQAAVEMVAATDGRTYAGLPVRNRIGIDTGHLIAGAVGAKGRLSYTVHGDAVNTAARLEALNKEHGTRVLVSGNTAGRVQGFDLRLVAERTVRGQPDPVRLFELEVEGGAPPAPDPRQARRRELPGS